MRAYIARQSAEKVVRVTKAGLAVITSHHYLAASSDGLVEDDACIDQQLGNANRGSQRQLLPFY